MNISDLIKNVQNKPLKFRRRVLAVGSGIAVLAVGGIWVSTIKQQIQRVDVSEVSSTITQAISTNSAPHYISVDSADTTNGNLLIYFYVKNDTTDILNFSKQTDITLAVNGQNYQPTKITDRTNAPFVQKILSNTTQFGILTFNNVSGSGTITFDNLYFEQSPDSIFNETDNLDLSKLPKPTEVRN